MKKYTSIDEIKRDVPNFFQHARTFKQIEYPTIYGGIFFIISTRYVDRASRISEPRVFSVRKCVDGDVFFAERENYKPVEHATKAEAEEAARRLACEHLGLPYYEHYKSIDAIKRANKNIGHHWFEPGPMQDFGTVVYLEIYGGIYFITSEPETETGPWKFAVRACHNGRIDTIDRMCQYDSHEDAQAAIRALIHQDEAINR